MQKWKNIALLLHTFSAFAFPYIIWGEKEQKSYDNKKYIQNKTEKSIVIIFQLFLELFALEIKLNLVLFVVYLKVCNTLRKQDLTRSVTYVKLARNDNKNYKNLKETEKRNNCDLFSGWIRFAWMPTLSLSLSTNRTNSLQKCQARVEKKKHKYERNIVSKNWSDCRPIENFIRKFSILKCRDYNSNQICW